MAIEQLMQSLLTASPAKRRQVEAVLSGKETVSNPQSKKDTRLVTISGAARLLAIGRNTAYRLLKCGRLDAVQLNGSQRITMQSINEFLAGERPANSGTDKIIQESKARHAKIRESKNSKEVC